MISELNLNWPDTKRKYPKDSKLEIRHPYDKNNYKSKYMDLCFFDSVRGVWVYISTLPRLEII